MSSPSQPVRTDSRFTIWAPTTRWFASTSRANTARSWLRPNERKGAWRRPEVCVKSKWSLRRLGGHRFQLRQSRLVPERFAGQHIPFARVFLVSYLLGAHGNADESDWTQEDSAFKSVGDVRVAAFAYIWRQLSPPWPWDWPAMPWNRAEQWP